MNRKLSNKLAMFNATNQILTKYPDDVNSIPVFLSSTTEFENKVSAIQELIPLQEGTSTGTTTQKHKEEEEMIAKTLQVAGAIFVYAQDQNNLELMTTTDVSPSSLSRMTNQSLLARCKEIHAAGVTIPAETGTTYGLSAELLTSLQQEIDDYESLVSQPRVKIVTRSQATRQIEQLVSEAGDILSTRIDKLMRSFKMTNPTFYGEYEAARIIIDLKTSAPKEPE